MPSAAQAEGERTLADMLPRGYPRPNVTIRARGEAIAYTVWPHAAAIGHGEYRATVVVPREDGRTREAALERLRQLLGRIVEMEGIVQLRTEERLACDLDEETECMVDDDMDVAPWRIHCPLALRRALDTMGADGPRRMTAFNEGRIQIGDVTVSIDDRRDETPGRIGDVWSDQAWIRRATITGPGIVYSQGMTRSYLRIDRNLPETIASAMVGRSPSDLVDLPGMDAAGLLVTGARRTRNAGLHFETTRVHGTLGPPPGHGA